MTTSSRLLEAVTQAKSLGMTDEDVLGDLIDFLKNHADPSTAEEAARYVTELAKARKDPEEGGFRFFLQGQQERMEVKLKLRTLAPIVASQGIRLLGVGPKELRDLAFCLRHIESEINRLNARVRQPWRL